MFKAEPGYAPSDIDAAIEQGKFAEAIILSWGFVEMFVDALLSIAFNLAKTDPRLEYVQDRNISDKIELLKKLKMLEPAEYHILIRFKGERNGIFHELFHRRGKIFQLQDKRVRDSTAELARDAAHGITYAYASTAFARDGNTGTAPALEIRKRHIKIIAEKYKLPLEWGKPSRSAQSTNTRSGTDS